MGTGNELAGSRKDVAAIAPLGNLPTTFRLATEDMIERENSERAKNSTDERDSGRGSNFGVQSLQDNVCDTPPEISRKSSIVEEKEPTEGRSRSNIKSSKSTNNLAHEEPQNMHQIPVAGSSPYQYAQRRSRQHSVAHSLASLSIDSQAPLSSFPSSPKSISNPSFRPSDEESVDENGSQAVVSSSEDDTQLPAENSIPQLVMPSIKMPSRRPFTERGRVMGRMKILVAGDSAIGKTSLIRSIVQTCEDIVHVDPIRPHQAKRKTKLRIAESTVGSSNELITEIFASTRPYPPWRADAENTASESRRKSIGDSVLERNLCFVDTPGYSHGLSKMQAIDATVQYIESQLSRSFSPSEEAEGNLINLLSGNGGSQVDLVLYMLSQRIKDEDMVFLQRLSALTNVIPLVAKSDTCSLEEVGIFRRSIHEQLRLAKIDTFTPSTGATGQSLYSVCSLPSIDDEVMDASLLMSSSYVQPLFASELGLLMQHIFDKETVSCLRHLASKKLVQNRRGDAHTSSLLHSFSTFSVISPNIQAKITDHMRQEERLAQLKLAKWASDLQRNMQSERAEYEAVTQNHRIGWLTEKLTQQTHEKTPSTTSVASKSVHERRPSSSSSFPKPSYLKNHLYHNNLLDAGDPLGLLHWNEAMCRRGWIALQVAGSFGLLGAVAMWAAKTWGGILGCGCGGSGDENRWAWNLFTGWDR